MRTRMLFVAVLVLGAGCVAFPHSALVAPPASGEVVEAKTLKPITGAKVVRNVEVPEQTFTTTTDGNGSFHFQKNTYLRWLGGCRAASPIQYRFLAEGYRTFETNLYGGGDFYRGTVPHDLGQIVLVRIPE